MSTQLGRTMRQIRLDRGMGQQEVATRTGIDRTLILRLESGDRTTASLDTLRRYVERMGLKDTEIVRLGLAILAPHGTERIRRQHGARVVQRGRPDSQKEQATQ